MATIAPDEEPRLDIREQLVRIDKMQAELQKVQVEITQIKMNTTFEPWRILLAAIAATVALFGAAAAFVKLIS